MEVYNIDGIEIFQSRIDKYKTFINFMEAIAEENEDKRSFNSEKDAIEYINEYCPNLELVLNKLI